MATDAGVGPADVSRRDRLFAGGVEALVVIASCAVVWALLDPAVTLTNTLPFTTDHTGMPVVVWDTARFLRELHLTGWSDSQFAGIPVNVLYPPLASIIAALISFTLPFGLAYKLAVALSVVATPVAAWGMARLARLPFPYPPLLAVAMVPFLTDTDCVVCGGNIPSTVSGEYAYQWGVVAALLAAGAAERLLSGGRGMALAAGLAGLAAIGHPVPALWTGVVILTLIILHRAWRQPRDVVVRISAAASVALLLAAWWWIPFASYRPWMTRLNIARADNYGFWLFPASPAWEMMLMGLAVLGVVLAARARHNLVIAIAIATAIAALAFVLLPEGQLYNLRVLPLWLLGRWILVFAGIAECALLLESRLRQSAMAAEAGGARRRGNAAVAAPAITLGAAALALFLPSASWGLIGTQTPPGDGVDGVGQIATITYPITRLAHAPTVVMAGYEVRPDAPELREVSDLLARTAREQGCGRLMWDRWTKTDRPDSPFGDDAVLRRAAMWTDGCIPSVEGILADSSATTSEFLMTSALVSEYPDQLIPGLPYPTLDLSIGREHMVGLGVRYYLTHGGAAQSAAEQTPGYVRVGTAGRWTLWQLDGWSPVQPLPALPAVVTPSVSDADWIPLTVGYSLDRDWAKVALAQDGPAPWPRVAPGEIPPQVPAPAATVTDIVAGADAVSFTVDQVGSPIAVRVSDFPGWAAEGAEGPYRISSNSIVVVPTQTRVTVRRTATTIDMLATGIGVAGLVGLLALVGWQLGALRSHKESSQL